MERLVVLAPALVPAALILGAFAVYSLLTAIGKQPPKRTKKERGNAFDYLIHFFHWFIWPVERTVFRSRLTPNQVTLAALACCVGAGLAIATRHLATAGWLYVMAGLLDILDGRLARHKKISTRSGAFLDSVTDRWGELFVFSGFAWFLRDSYWLLAVLLAMSGSLMVSYTRARGEALNIDIKGGIMQRGERIFLVSSATLVTAWFDAVRETQEYGIAVIGVALTITGILTAATAIGRWVRGFRELERLEKLERGDDPDVEVPVTSELRDVKR